MVTGGALNTSTALSAGASTVASTTLSADAATVNPPEAMVLVLILISW
ncbi:MAG: hypothetical protein MUO77_17740 [Anaerolineales bacterium]|nr:hypothetical protein [Anaerolineales bacterium]